MELDFTQLIINVAFALIFSFLLASIVVACSVGIFLAIGFWNKSKKRHSHYDDDTLERMKHYYKIDDHESLLRFIKIHGLTAEDLEVE